MSQENNSANTPVSIEQSIDKFTPGPWVVCYDGQIDGNKGKTKVCNLPFSSFKEFNDNEEVKANARLISQAPAMYNALKILSNMYDSLPESRKKQEGGIFAYNHVKLTVAHLREAKEIINRINK